MFSAADCIIAVQCHPRSSISVPIENAYRCIQRIRGFLVLVRYTNPHFTYFFYLFTILIISLHCFRR